MSDSRRQKKRKKRHVFFCLQHLVQCWYLEILLEPNCLVFIPCEFPKVRSRAWRLGGDCIFAPPSWKLLKERGLGSCLSGNPGPPLVSASPNTSVHTCTYAQTHTHMKVHCP